MAQSIEIWAIFPWQGSGTKGY